MLASAGSLAQYLALSGGPFGGGWTTLIAAGVYKGGRGLHIHCEGSGNGVVGEGVGEGVDCVGWGVRDSAISRTKARLMSSSLCVCISFV